MKSGVLIGHPNKYPNEALLLRTAEAFGINLVFVIGEKHSAYRVSQGADKHMVFMEFSTFNNFKKYAFAHNHSIVCVEDMNNSINICDVTKYPINPIFVTGNERDGLEKEMLDAADLTIHIPQGNGYIPCLNTAIAASIVLYDFFTKTFLGVHKL